MAAWVPLPSFTYSATKMALRGARARLSATDAAPVMCPAKGVQLTVMGAAERGAVAKVQAPVGMLALEQDVVRLEAQGAAAALDPAPMSIPAQNSRAPSLGRAQGARNRIGGRYCR